MMPLSRAKSDLKPVLQALGTLWQRGFDLPQSMQVDKVTLPFLINRLAEVSLLEKVSYI